MFTCAEDLKTLLVAHDFTANALISTDPTIILHYEDHPATYPENGLIIIGDESLNNEVEYIKHSEFSYRILLEVQYDSTTSAYLKALLTEIKSAFNTNNDTSGRSYFWKILYNWKGLVKLGNIQVMVDAVEEWVAR